MAHADNNDQPRITIPFPPLTARQVWHYTGPDGLLGITSQDALWATAPQVLNDSGEFTNGLRTVRAVLGRLAEDVTPEAQPLIDDLMSDRWANGVLDSACVASASASPNIITQWQSYAQADGFAIRFDLDDATGWFPKTSSMATSSATGTNFLVLPTWRPVIYEAIEQADWVERMLRVFLQAIPHWLSDRFVLDLAKMSVATLALLLKHPGFRAEEEVRLVVPVVSDALKFRTSKRRLLPYVEVGARRYNPSDPDNSIPTRLPIGEVVCGPASADTAVRTVERLLSLRGLPTVRVTRSPLPLAY